MILELIPPPERSDLPRVKAECSDTEPTTVTITVGTIELPALDKAHLESLYSALDTLANAAREAPVDKLEESAGLEPVQAATT